jgi:predicted DsbA family dithiol-disulfide isomerase
VYFDYMCSYSWRLAELIEMTADDSDMRFEWRHFSIYQYDHDQRTDRNAASNGHPYWQLWNQRIEEDDGSGCKGLLPFLASAAARRQGDEAYRRFRLGLLRAVHLEYRPLARATIVAVAVDAHLHMPTFLEELDNPESRTALAQEHMNAVGADVVSTPTVVFPGSHTAHLRLQQLPVTAAEAVNLLLDTMRLLERYPFLHTVTRPVSKGN